MTTFDERENAVGGAFWRKSSWSAFNGNCVEVAPMGEGWIGVRDTKDRGEGPVLFFENDSWREFLNQVKRNDLDLAS